MHFTCIFPQVRLSPAEGSDVLKRWAEHLCSPQVNQKSKAILVLLSLGCFYKVGEMLHRYSENTSGSVAGWFIYPGVRIEKSISRSAAAHGRATYRD